MPKLVHFRVSEICRRTVSPDTKAIIKLFVSILDRLQAATWSLVRGTVWCTLDISSITDEASPGDLKTFTWFSMLFRLLDRNIIFIVRFQHLHRSCPKSMEHGPRCRSKAATEYRQQTDTTFFSWAETAPRSRSKPLQEKLEQTLYLFLLYLFHCDYFYPLWFSLVYFAICSRWSKTLWSIDWLFFFHPKNQQQLEIHFNTISTGENWNAFQLSHSARAFYMIRAEQRK